MAEANMTEQDYQQIEAYIKENFSQWIIEQEQKLSASGISPLAGFALSERIVRVEEELKHQYEAIKDLQKSMDARFSEQQTRSDQRFAEMQAQSDKRFEEMQTYMDRRFNDMQTQMDRRFEEVDKRFEQVDRRFEQVDRRFEQVDKRFEDVEKRFEQMDKRFDESNRRFTIFSSILALLIAAVPVGLALAGL